MTKPTVEAHFGTWSVPEIPLAIEYRADVMEEMRAAACEGLQQLTHGGLEVGGILFGSRSGDTIRITKWRPIACEHAEGPTLRLSTRDRIGLTRQLEVAKSDPDLAGLLPVGWFLSHCRSDIFLTAAELEIYNGFFGDPWQVTLVLRPTRPGLARAGFFAREPSGVLRSESSYKDFTVDPLHRPAPFVERRATPRRNLPLAPNTKPEPRQQPRVERRAPVLVEPPSFSTGAKRARSTGGQWMWAIPGCLAMLIIGAIVNQRFGLTLVPVVNPPFSFHANSAGDTVLLEWDTASPTIRSAKRAVLEVSDGTNTQRNTLTAAQLKRGKITYPRPASDLDLRLTVYPANGSLVQESARLLSPASPANSDRGRLEEEIRQLKEELRIERAKNKKEASSTRP